MSRSSFSCAAVALSAARLELLLGRFLLVEQVALLLAEHGAPEVVHRALKEGVGRLGRWEGLEAAVVSAAGRGAGAASSAMREAEKLKSGSVALPTNLAKHVASSSTSKISPRLWFHWYRCARRHNFEPDFQSASLSRAKSRYSSSLHNGNNATPLTYVLLTRPPLTRRPLFPPRRRLQAENLLACSFITWLPLLVPDEANVGLLFDCANKAEADKEIESAILASPWVANVSVPITTRCHRGGVCTRHNNDTRYALACYKGTSALLEWLATDTFSTTQYFVKVDTDAVVAPYVTLDFVRRKLLDLGDARTTIIYSGSDYNTWAYRYCSPAETRLPDAL